MTDTPAAIEARGLGKRYRRRWGLQDCSFELPAGKVAALVGPNGAGKSTLLRLAAGLAHPTTGSIRVAGYLSGDQSEEALATFAYLDQERPLYKAYKVDEMLRLGRCLNPSWDDDLADSYLDRLGIPRDERVGKLSVGQQAQVALTICLAKRPRVLLLDEPTAALDPLARQQLMQVLLSSVADFGTTVLISSHALADLEQACDYLMILSAARVQIADDLESVLETHKLLVGPRRSVIDIPGTEVVSATHTDRQSSILLRDVSHADLGLDGFDVMQPTLEEVVVAYLRQQTTHGSASAAGSSGEAVA
ncbi:MAG TPA: ABC transporter ATP-binding protein [Acidimicrobiales bacterium]|nr:ABC transporter ATP-binding protein [Acidimicrobiales bacterium]